MVEFIPEDDLKGPGVSLKKSARSKARRKRKSGVAFEIAKRSGLGGRERRSRKREGALSSGWFFPRDSGHLLKGAVGA